MRHDFKRVMISAQSIILFRPRCLRPRVATSTPQEYGRQALCLCYISTNMPSLISAISVLALLGGMVAAPALARAGSQPNILFILSDDQSFETVRSLGLTDIHTPNLDRLAASGAMFTHAYNMGSWSPAVCIPSRTMLVTGQSLWRSRAVYERTGLEMAAGRLWPQLLERQGYSTWFTGKWHVNTDAARTFNTARNIRPGMPKDAKQGYNRPLAGQPDNWSPSDPAFGGFWEGGRHWSEVTADDAISFLGESKQDGRPFFMYVAFNAPHDPRQSPGEFVDQYPLARIEAPENFLPEYPHSELIGSGRNLRDEKLGPFPRTRHSVKVHRQEYYAMITHMDAQIGRILDALEASGQGQNTWVFFTSDHGLAVGRHGLFGKQNMYDHSLRVPFIVAGPGVPSGRRISTPIYLQDVMPTTLELAGAEKPAHVDFRSILPLLRGGKSPAARNDIYAAYLDLQRAVMHDGWKLMLYPKAQTARLYHLDEDPLEMRDLAADPQFAPLKRHLFKRLLEQQKEFGDSLELAAAFPELRN
jgi:arylsulfatase A-like enzyme